MVFHRDGGILQPTSISRTALDSLNAKLSAIDAGWLDDGYEGRSRREGRSDTSNNNDNHNNDPVNDDDVGEDNDSYTRRINGNLGLYCQLLGLRRIGECDGTEEGLGDSSDTGGQKLGQR